LKQRNNGIKKWTTNIDVKLESKPLSEEKSSDQSSPVVVHLLQLSLPTQIGTFYLLIYLLYNNYFIIIYFMYISIDHIKQSKHVTVFNSYFTVYKVMFGFQHSVKYIINMIGRKYASCIVVVVSGMQFTIA